jgi:hypothetical protein
MRTTRLFRAVTALAIALAAPAAALAQGTGRSLDIDVSIRASAMGQASEAVFWGDELNQWSNPALLGYARGLRYEWGKTRLVPGLAADVFFRSNVVKLGAGGLGVSLSGKPGGLGSVRLSYGQSIETDPNGTPIGTFESFEKIDSWGFGLSVAQGLETLAKLAGRETPGLARMADVSVGMNSKKIDMFLGPTGAGGTTSLDRGLLVRVSPLEVLPASRDLPLALDLAYGWSELSYDDATITFPGESGPTPLSHHHRHGWAARGALEIPSGVLAGARRHRGGWLLEGLDPLLSYGYADDRARIEPSNGQFKTHGKGYEIAIANVFFSRSGHYSDPLGEIEGDTDGWGLQLPIGRFGGLRYDHATIPQAMNSGLPDVKRDAVSGWLDPLELWRAWQTRPRSI